MQLIMIGDLADREDILDNLPKRGIVIEATKEELMNFPNLLYKDKRINQMEELLNKIHSVIELFDIPDSWKIDVDILDNDTIALNGVGTVNSSQLQTRDIILDRIADEVIKDLGDEYSRDSLTWYLSDGTMIDNGTTFNFHGEEKMFDSENEEHCKLVDTSQVLLMVD